MGENRRTVSLDLPDADVLLVRGFLRAEESSDCFRRLLDEASWEVEVARIRGRLVPVPRRTAWYGDPGSDYSYSGVRHEPHAWTPLLLDLRARVEAEVRSSFNSVLLNHYRDGRDGVSWHSDDEPELGERPCIASLSLGSTRTFQLKHRRRRDLDRVDVPLPPGSLLVMGGDCQHSWRHQVPKRLGRDGPGPRINLTFRLVRPPPGGGA